MKKMLNYILCSAMFIGLFFSTTVSAAEKGDTGKLNNAGNVTEHITNAVSPEIQDGFEKIKSLDMLQEGDIRVLGTWNEEIYYVEVMDAAESSYSTYGFDDPVKSKTFLFTKENALGIKTNLMAVTAKLTWIRNGKITSFECSEEIYHPNVYASWEPGYFIQSDVIWGRGLNVTWDNGESEYLGFTGTVIYMEGKEKVSIDFYD